MNSKATKFQCAHRGFTPTSGGLWDLISVSPSFRFLIPDVCCVFPPIRVTSWSTNTSLKLSFCAFAHTVHPSDEHVPVSVLSFRLRRLLSDSPQWPPLSYLLPSLFGFALPLWRPLRLCHLSSFGTCHFLFYFTSSSEGILFYFPYRRVSLLDLDQELANILCKGQVLNILCVCMCVYVSHTVCKASTRFCCFSMKAVINDI